MELAEMAVSQASAFCTPLPGAEGITTGSGGENAKGNQAVGLIAEHRHPAGFPGVMSLFHTMSPMSQRPWVGGPPFAPVSTVPSGRTVPDQIGPSPHSWMRSSETVGLSEVTNAR